MHNPEIDSLWEYEGQDGQTLWKAYTEGQYCDIYSSCTALKHDGKITPMGQDLLDTTEMIKWNIKAEDTTQQTKPTKSFTSVEPTRWRKSLNQNSGRKWQRSGGKNTKTQIVDFLVNRCFLRCEIVDIHEILPIKKLQKWSINPEIASLSIKSERLIKAN